MGERCALSEKEDPLVHPDQNHLNTHKTCADLRACRICPERQGRPLLADEVLQLLEGHPTLSLAFLEHLVARKEAEPRHCAQLGLAYVAKVEEDESVAFMGEAKLLMSKSERLREVCLSQARKRELQALFHSADKDDSGLLSFTEMSLVLREGNPELTDKELALLFREIDTNGDLTVDFKEFAKYLNSMSAGKLQKSKSREQVTAERCKEEFFKVDENSDGKLSREEMAELLRKGNPEITEDELTLLFDTMDQDGNGSLDFEEFVDYITGFQRPKPEKVSDFIPWVETVPLPEAYERRSSTLPRGDERGLFLHQLFALAKLIKEVLEKCPLQSDSASGPSRVAEGGDCLTWITIDMYQCSKHFLQPLTIRFQCSFVELIAEKPQVSMLKFHQEQRETGGETAWWMDAFARSLHGEEVTNFPMPQDFEQSPFCKVLISKSCKGTVVLLDGKGRATGRSWCLLELALSLDMQLDKSTTHLTDIVAWNEPLKKAAMLADTGDGTSEEVLREPFGAIFPMDLSLKGYRTAVQKSEATLEADRKRILHFLASTPADSWDRLKPPTDSVAYTAVNGRLQHRFIAGAMAAAAMMNDEKTLRKIASEHPEFQESCTAYGFRPLHAAAMKGSLHTLKVLISLNCDLNAPSADGRTPLFVAAREGHDATVTHLLKAKADVHQTSMSGHTALHASIEGGHITISGSLLDFKADPNFSAAPTETPLILAARNDQAATCGLLLDYKADPLKESLEGQKPYEVVQSSQKLVDTLKEAAKEASKGRTARRRPSVQEARIVNGLSQFCSKEVKASRQVPFLEEAEGEPTAELLPRLEALELHEELVVLCSREKRHYEALRILALDLNDLGRAEIYCRLLMRREAQESTQAQWRAAAQIRHESQETLLADMFTDPSIVLSLAGCRGRAIGERGSDGAHTSTDAFAEDPAAVPSRSRSIAGFPERLEAHETAAEKPESYKKVSVEYRDAVLALLMGYAGHRDVPPNEVLGLLPSHWTLEGVAEYLSQCARICLHQQRASMLEENLSSMAYLKTFSAWAKERMRKVNITVDRCCPVCNKRFVDKDNVGKAFVAYPNETCVHFTCKEHPSICPKTGKNFSDNLSVYCPLATGPAQNAALGCKDWWLTNVEGDDNLFNH
ncbi:unnamed protein product [Durusdinium trenchii]|uniref:EF-hand domain-containing protein n=1 Tax=Durusdinium trenchii TaxID=1381693 RepID=A0ABP0HKA1_9DINO